MTAPERETDAALVEQAILGPQWQGDLVLVVPYGKRAIRLRVPQETALWLWRQLDDVLGEPRRKARRPVRLKRGRWTNRRAA